jgi:glycine/D-amino acid oxidase-like deaminating enzyme
VQTQSLAQVVIVGGGFEGLSAAKELAGEGVGVTLIDKVHLISLVGFRNRLLLLFQWTFCYFTFSRGARLIYGSFRPNKEPLAASNEGTTA